jgi:hypothetical protein
MSNRFNLSDPFIYDLANNHQGNFEHSSNIVREGGRVNCAALETSSVPG